jgi:hypothetical protein
MPTPAYTSRDQDDQIHNDWSNADITEKLFDGYPESVTYALRPLASRFANNANKITDPMSVLGDLGHIVESLAAAVTTLVREHGLDEDVEDDDVHEALSGLHAASSALESLGNNL